MCDNWRRSYFKKYMCSGEMLTNSNGNIVIKGTVKSSQLNPKITYWASAPPNYRTSYTGSALPYPNPTIAYQNTPNKGTTIANNRQFQINLKFPNSYYAGFGNVYMQPHIHFKICEGENSCDDKVFTLNLSEGTPFRLLTYPSPPETAPRCSPMFYYGRDRYPVRTQEQILVDSGYPKENKMPKNFWGLAIPHP